MGKGDIVGYCWLVMVYDDIRVFISVPNRNWDYHNPWIGNCREPAFVLFLSIRFMVDNIIILGPCHSTISFRYRDVLTMALAWLCQSSGMPQLFKSDIWWRSGFGDFTARVVFSYGPKENRGPLAGATAFSAANHSEFTLSGPLKNQSYEWERSRGLEVGRSFQKVLGLTVLKS